TLRGTAVAYARPAGAVAAPRPALATLAEPPVQAATAGRPWCRPASRSLVAVGLRAVAEVLAAGPDRPRNAQAGADPPGPGPQPARDGPTRTHRPFSGLRGQHFRARYPGRGAPAARSAGLRGGRSRIAGLLRGVAPACRRQRLGAGNCGEHARGAVGLRRR